MNNLYAYTQDISGDYFSALYSLLEELLTQKIFTFYILTIIKQVILQKKCRINLFSSKNIWQHPFSTQVPTY